MRRCWSARRWSWPSSGFRSTTAGRDIGPGPGLGPGLGSRRSFFTDTCQLELNVETGSGEPPHSASWFFVENLLSHKKFSLSSTEVMEIRVALVGSSSTRGFE